MTVYRKNITINVGETFSEDLTLMGADGSGVVDLTGYSAQSKIRKSPTNYRFADIQVGIVNPSQGQINISIASTITKLVLKTAIIFLLLFMGYKEVNHNNIRYR